MLWTLAETETKSQEKIGKVVCLFIYGMFIPPEPQLQMF